MKSRVVRDLNLRAANQHLRGVNGIPFMQRICLGAVRKPKTRVTRFNIRKKRI
jgi:hypothetical protein